MTNSANPKNGAVHLASADAPTEEGGWTACRLWSPARPFENKRGRMVHTLTISHDGSDLTCKRCKAALRMRQIVFGSDVSTVMNQQRST